MLCVKTEMLVEKFYAAQAIITNKLQGGERNRRKKY
jgi:hypothetical protein